MRDLLPDQKETYRYVEDVIRDVLGSYGYREIGLPVLESTQLFQRLMGEATDVVEKEMYTFDDRNGDSLTLRPEGTAGCVRAAQENGLLFNQTQRLWYSGPMFRHERPQKGRYRQFDSIGAECFGMAGPDIDAELLLLSAEIWRRLDIQEDLRLEINSLGSNEARVAFKQALVDYLSAHRGQLDEDSQRRLSTNPLRILDSKDEQTRQILSSDQVPLLTDYLDEESQAHFATLCSMLDRAGLAYRVNHRIVRGLDYYNRTVFEWITETLGAQGTVCGGGRYDGLVEIIGGRPTPAIGFGIGIDRLALMLMEKDTGAGRQSVDIFIVSMGENTRIEALLMAEELRRAEPGRHIVVHCGEGKLKSQMKKADASGACMALIVGEEELARGQVAVKRLRREAEQESISRLSLTDWLRSVAEEF